MSCEKPSPEPPKSSKTHKSPTAKAVDFINKSRLRSHKPRKSNDDSNISSDVSSPFKCVYQIRMMRGVWLNTTEH